jgi:hypothetical protein
VRGPVIDAHRYTADVAIHVHIIVAHHGQSFKTPPAYQTVHAKRPPRQRLRSSRLLDSNRPWVISVRTEALETGSRRIGSASCSSFIRRRGVAEEARDCERLALFPLNLCKAAIQVDHDSTAPGSAKEQSQYRWHWDHPAI